MLNRWSRHSAVSSTRSPSGERAPHSPKYGRGAVGAERLEARAQRLPAHADGVDLVDEHDALAAPLGGELLGLARQPAHEHRVHADERLREAGARDRHERAVEGRGDRLGEHRLAGARRAQEQHAALALAAGLLELLAGLPEADHAGDLLLGLGLAADVGELDAPVRVPRLVALDLLDAEEQHRPEQDQEVREEQDRDDRDVRQRAGANAAIRSPSVLTAPLIELSPPVNALAMITITIATAKVRNRNQSRR